MMSGSMLKARHTDGRMKHLVGMDINKLSILMEDMNFTTTWHEETQFGVYDKLYGKWSGMIGGLASDKYAIFFTLQSILNTLPM